MKKIKVFQIDAFTDQLFGGNPAGVVIDANELGETEMKKVAREMNLSETAFVLNSDSSDFKIRYFTPEKEVKFCGHATVGTLYSLALENMFGLDKGVSKEFKVETGAGEIIMKVQNNDEIKIQFDAPKIDLVETNYTHGELKEVLGITEDIFDVNIPITRENTNDFIYVYVNTLEELGVIEYDYNKFKTFTDKENIVVACFATVHEGEIYSRVFGPSIGLVEDPVTGATQGGLAAFLHSNWKIENIEENLKSNQGEFCGRPGSLEIKLEKEGDIYSAKIFASAVKVFEAEVELS